MADLFDIKLRVKNVSISDGTSIELSDQDAVIIVGPNNAGKSRFLKDIENLALRDRSNVSDTKVVTEISFDRPSNAVLYSALLPYRNQKTDNFANFGVAVHKNAIEIALNMGDDNKNIGEIARFFVKRVSSDDRLSIVSPSPSVGDQEPQTPGQILYDNESLLKNVSDLFYRAFKREVFVDYRCGGQIPLYVGQKPAIPDGCDRVSDQYVKLVRSCDKLHEQGDGMKSFGGIMLSTLVLKYNVTLVDEPEAFLHPPQERLIGRIIADETSGQVFCSTHSKNVLQGFLESGRQNVRVMRITRSGDVNHVKEILPAEIANLWNDPVFRYSTALEALFHDRAVLCEAEPDCRFYEALERHVNPEGSLDSHFIPCSGKAAFPKFSRALRKLGVPVVAILDLDVLNDEATLKSIFEAQGGVWANIAALWKRTDCAVRSGVKTQELESIKEKIGDILDEWENGAAPISKINEAISQRKPWTVVKEMGLDAIPSGDAQNTVTELMESLAEFSIFAVPVGTMEKLVRSVGNHGNK